MSEYYVGLISGTSVDSIDAVVVDLANNEIQLCQSHSLPIPDDLRNTIINLFEPGDNEIDRLGEVDVRLGLLFAEATKQVVRKAGLTHSDIVAVGSHGQTIRHRPADSSSSLGFTLQIGDPNTIAELTGITTVADFRRRDMACGGQGAPFAPCFHQALVPSDIETVVFLNMGGIANITLIHEGKVVVGFDTGPANCLMDSWIQRHKNRAYDANGDWAKSGEVDNELLVRLLSDDYFSRPAPKSTGREQFTLHWLEQHLNSNGGNKKVEDVQATLLALSSHSISNAIHALTQQASRVYCCGGGTQNLALVAHLKSLCPNITFSDTTELGIDPDWIEASAFAWFTQRTLCGKALELMPITGSKAARVAGAIYHA